MFEIKDFQTLYNMVVASFIILTLSLFSNSYIKNGEVLDMMAMFAVFKGTETVIMAWVVMTTVFYLILVVTKIALRTSRYVWIPLYITHLSLILYVATHFAGTKHLGFASIIIIMAEATRMVLKAHSYIRTKLLYLKDNPYKDFEFRGVKVVNTQGTSTSQETNDKTFRISIEDSDIFR